MNPNSSLSQQDTKEVRYPSHKHQSYHYSRERERSDRPRDHERYYKSQHHPNESSSNDYMHHSSTSMNYYDRPYDKKKLYCYILLPKNYYNYITKNFQNLTNDLRSEIKDISNIQYDYTLPHFQEYIFKLATYRISSKANAIKIISDYLFKEMKSTYKTMTYLKVSILIPDNVIGFIIGIDGKNINNIRAETDAKIEVFPQNESKKYRKIEISGNPYSISRAAERIYCITYKYINFGKDARFLETKETGRRHRYSNSKSKSYSRSPSSDRGYKRSRPREEGLIRGDSSEERGKYYKERDRRKSGMDSAYASKLRENKEYRERRDRERERDYRDKNIISSSSGRRRERNDNYSSCNNNNSRYENISNSNNILNNNQPNVISNSNINPPTQVNNNTNLSNSDINLNGNIVNNSNKSSSLPNSRIEKEAEHDPNDILHEISNPDIIDAQASTKEVPPSVPQVPSSPEREDFANINEDPTKQVVEQVDLSKSDFAMKLKLQQNSPSSQDIRSLDIILSLESINILKQYKNNIWLELENTYHCSVSKKTERLNDKEISIITFTGTPEENSFALYHLQKILLSSSENVSK